jgi:hypothetical protein
LSGPTRAITPQKAALAKQKEGFGKQKTEFSIQKANFEQRSQDLSPKLTPTKLKWWKAGKLVARWSALAVSLVTVAHFGAAARLDSDTTNIIQIELGTSKPDWDACGCKDAFETAVQRDFWFIAAYVLGVHWVRTRMENGV